MSFYTVQYKIAVDLGLSEQPLEIKRSEKFIERIVLETVQENSKTFLLITFFIPKEAYGNCQYEDIPIFLDIDQTYRDSFFCPLKPEDSLELWRFSSEDKETVEESIPLEVGNNECVSAVKYHIIFAKTEQLSEQILNFLAFYFHLSISLEDKPISNIPEELGIYYPERWVSLQCRHGSVTTPILQGEILDIFKTQLQDNDNRMSSIYASFHTIKKNAELDSVSKFVGVTHLRI